MEKNAKKKKKRKKSRHTSLLIFAVEKKKYASALTLPAASTLQWALFQSPETAHNSVPSQRG